jgi:hypothetical protein
MTIREDRFTVPFRTTITIATSRYSRASNRAQGLEKNPAMESPAARRTPLRSGA